MWCRACVGPLSRPNVVIKELHWSPHAGSFGVGEGWVGWDHGLVGEDWEAGPGLDTCVGS